MQIVTAHSPALLQPVNVVDKLHHFC